MSLLWYREPAKIWEEAMPLGNGRIGAMVFGQPGSERIQVNEESIHQHNAFAEKVASIGELKQENNLEG